MKNQVMVFWNVYHLTIIPRFSLTSFFNKIFKMYVLLEQEV